MIDPKIALSSVLRLDALWTVELLHWYLTLQINTVRCVSSVLELLSTIDILYDQIVS